MLGAAHIKRGDAATPFQKDKCGARAVQVVLLTCASGGMIYCGAVRVHIIIAAQCKVQAWVLVMLI